MEPPRLLLFSTPLISTFILDETHRILFDAGDGAAAMLEGKLNRVQHIALTHAHRDHIGGLLQVLNLRGDIAAEQGEPLRVLYPEASGSIIALGQFLSEFDPATTGRVHWLPLRAEMRVPLSHGRFLSVFPTIHLPGSQKRLRSVGYRITRKVERLKPELRGAAQEELDRIRREEGRSAILCAEEETLFVYSGDTVPLSPETYRGARWLLHECTFLEAEAAEERSAHRERHSCLPEVIAMAQAAGVERLGLCHISKRYSDEEILAAVRQTCAEQGVSMRVSVALPGRLYNDFFSQCVWNP